MAKIDITGTELVWPCQYDDDGNLMTPPGVTLPFQVIECVDETRATRQGKENALAGPWVSSLISGKGKALNTQKVRLGGAIN